MDPCSQLLVGNPWTPWSFRGGHLASQGGVREKPKEWGKEQEAAVAAVPPQDVEENVHTPLDITVSDMACMSTSTFAYVELKDYCGWTLLEHVPGLVGASLRTAHGSGRRTRSCYDSRRTREGEVLEKWRAVSLQAIQVRKRTGCLGIILACFSRMVRLVESQRRRPNTRSRHWRQAAALPVRTAHGPSRRCVSLVAPTHVHCNLCTRRGLPRSYGSVVEDMGFMLAGRQPSRPNRTTGSAIAGGADRASSRHRQCHRASHLCSRSLR